MGKTLEKAVWEIKRQINKDFSNKESFSLFFCFDLLCTELEA